MMTEIERKALAIIAEIKAERGLSGPDYLSARAALIRAIEQHEAFKREVSDAIEYFMDGPVGLGTARERLGRFLIAKPVDPLVEALNEAGDTSPLSDDAFEDAFADAFAKELRQAIAARGLKITNI